MKTAIHKTINTILRPLKLQITRTNQVSQTANSAQNLMPLKTDLKQWKIERQYWGNLLQDFYKSEYDLSFHPIQSDDSIVPPQSLVNGIQSTHMAVSDGFFGSSYRNIYAYLTELKD